ncbi:PstS family phosphate ABC transporter substrate-binding protein [Holophaga foetida]|uniref:PstS family phosphate ABC transporter substrate-binding protein n=1 Tax=Holophaga foetida TaxID=35839 RepID=UPI00024732D1|nr:substrate-binding domain-containing protein [Holophaga foetida]
MAMSFLRRTLTPVVLSLVCLSQAPAQAPQPLVAKGFQGMFYITAVLTGAYAGRTPGVVPDVQIIGESQAMKELTEGSTQIALMGRDLQPEEEAAFIAKWGYSPTRVAIAMDALVVLVNKNNPIKEIKVEQLDAIYSIDRRQGWPKDVTTWGDLGLKQGGWENRPIERFGRPADSGNYWLLNETLTMKGRPRLPIRGNMDATTLTEELAANQAAIAYGNMIEKFSSTRIVPLVPKGSKEPVEANAATVTSGEYPLCRFLYAYINKDPKKGTTPLLRGFLSFALSPAGQGIIKECGQVPLQPDINALNRLKVTDRFDGDSNTLR